MSVDWAVLQVAGLRCSASSLLAVVESKLRRSSKRWPLGTRSPSMPFSLRHSRDDRAMDKKHIPFLLESMSVVLASTSAIWLMRLSFRSDPKQHCRYLKQARHLIESIPLLMSDLTAFTSQPLKDVVTTWIFNPYLGNAY